MSLPWPQSLYASNALSHLAEAMFNARKHYYGLDSVEWTDLSSWFKSEFMDEAKRWLENQQPQRIVTGLKGKVIGAINWQGEAS